MPRFVTKETYVSHREKILHEIRKQIIDGFNTLDAVKMDALEQAAHYRKKLISFAKSGKQRTFFID